MTHMFVLLFALSSCSHLKQTAAECATHVTPDLITQVSVALGGTDYTAALKKIQAAIEASSQAEALCIVRATVNDVVARLQAPTDARAARDQLAAKKLANAKAWLAAHK